MVQGVEDILEELEPLFALQQPAASATRHEPRSAPGDAWLLRLVGFEPTSLDDLVQRSARPVAEVMAELTALELGGQVDRIAGGYIRS
jgi:DNA processing protein